MRFKNVVRICLSLFLLTIFSECVADTVAMQITPNQVTLGQTFAVSYLLNSQASNVSPDFSEFEQDFRVLDTNYGKSVQIVNGSVSSQVFWRLILEPKKAGELTLPVIHFGNVNSEARKIFVSGNTNAVATSQQTAPVFIQAYISNNTPYIQSQVLYTIKIFYRAQLENSRIQIPQVPDATLFQFDNDFNYQTTVNGKKYNVIEKTFAFFPEKTGEIAIQPVQFSTVAYEVDPNVGNNPFYIATPKSVVLKTKQIKLNVIDPPASYHGSTWLPAKNIALSETWSDTSGQWQTGNPVTRTISVAAQGLRGDQIPDFTFEKIPGVNSYAEAPKRKNLVQGRLIVGTLQQKITYIPNEAKTYTIPGVKLDWWNVQTNSNAVAELYSTAVTVNGVLRSTHITPPANVGSVNKQNTKPPFYSSIWFWIALFFLVSWLVTILIFWRKKPKVAEIVDHKVSLSEKDFKQACEQGNAIYAQQYLLSWAKQHWHANVLNLDHLTQVVNNDDFTVAVKQLEHAIYSKQALKWDGHGLLYAFKQIKVHQRKEAEGNKDPLPPLHLLA